jgi:hypothetical protein
VTGITISSYQVGRAEKLTKAAGLQNLVRFHTMDFTNTTFDDNVWDRVYAIEVQAEGHLLLLSTHHSHTHTLVLFSPVRPSTFVIGP